MDKSVRIVHFSDIHFTPRAQFIRSNYDEAVSVINKTPHDFAVFSGDLTQDGLIDEYELADTLRREII